MEPNIILWSILLVAFVVVELATIGLASIWFAAGALVALVLAIFNVGFVFQVLAFFVVSIVLMLLTRPIAKRFINDRAEHTNADRAIGETIRIQERVCNLDQTGMAVVRGQEWTVRAEDDKEIFEAGELVEVARIEGVKLIVRKAKED